jgi:hypothetical protein
MNAPTTSRRSGLDEGRCRYLAHTRGFRHGDALAISLSTPVRVSAGSWSVAHATAADFASDGRVLSLAHPA